MAQWVLHHPEGVNTFIYYNGERESTMAKKEEGERERAKKTELERKCTKTGVKEIRKKRLGRCLTVAPEGPTSPLAPGGPMVPYTTYLQTDMHSKMDRMAGNHTWSPILTQLQTDMHSNSMETDRMATYSPVQWPPIYTE